MTPDDPRTGTSGSDASPPIGERIRRRREELDIPAKELARRVGISASYLSLIERQGRVPSPSIAARLADELGDDVGLYLAWSRSKDIGDLDAYARRLERLVRWTTDPQARRRVASGEDLEHDEADDVRDEGSAVEEAAGLFADMSGMAEELLERARRDGLGSPRERERRYRSLSLRSPAPEDAPGMRDLHLAFEADEGPLAVSDISAATVREPTGLVSIPLLPNGADPAEHPEPIERLRLDARLLPPGSDDGFAYRVDLRAAHRIRDLVRPGDLVVLARRPGSFDRHSIHAVRHGGRVVLTRAAVKAGMLAMLPAPGDPSSIEWIPLRSEDEPGTRVPLERVVAGSVIATLRWWGEGRPPHGPRSRPR